VYILHNNYTNTMSNNITGEKRKRTDEDSSNEPPVKKQKLEKNEIQSITAEEARSLLVERKKTVC